jgi:hypothetical protein
MKKEEQLQIAVCIYLKAQYSNVVFFSDASGVRLTIGQAVKAKKMRSGKAIPDLFIAQPTTMYHGLFIELKAESPYNKNGTLKKNEHLQEQLQMIQLLQTKGYYATFATGFDEAQEIIDSYFQERI